MRVCGTARSLLVTVSLVLCMVCTTAAQVRFENDSTSTRAERLEYVLGASAAFGLFDYVGINLAHDLFRHSSIDRVNAGYHVALGLVGAALNYFLWRRLGLPSALSFDVLWWSWTNDFAYMAWANVLNPASPWPNRTTERFTQTICCAGWTPVGLLQGYKSSLPRSTLIAQSAFGIGVSMALIW